MARVQMDVETKLEPTRVLEAFTDFSDRRPDIWPALSRNFFQVYKVSRQSAVVREGQDRPRIWAKERYDWSTPGTVTWTSEESNFQAPGSYVSIEVAQKPDGGSRLHVDWSRQPTTVLGRVIVALM